MATKPAVQKVEIALTALELQEVQAWANDICTKCRSAFDDTPHQHGNHNFYMALSEPQARRLVRKLLVEAGHDPLWIDDGTL